MIDADALSEKLCKTTIFIKGGEIFQRLINDAPTIESDVDTISRQDAILAITGEPPEAHYPSWYADRIKSLPSAPDSRQRGEWVTLERDENVYDIYGVPTWGVNYMCDKCGFITTAIQDHFAQYRWCPSCGARMYKGGEDE